MAHSNFIDSIRNLSYILEGALKVEDPQSNIDENLEALDQLSCNLEVPNEEQETLAPLVQIKAEDNLDLLDDVQITVESCEGPTLGYVENVVTDDVYSFACSLCELKFRSKESLDTHASTHTTDKKPYTCTVCRLAFQRKSSLKNHSKIHTYGNLNSVLPVIPEEPSKEKKALRKNKKDPLESKIPPFETLKPNSSQFSIEDDLFLQDWLDCPTKIKQETPEVLKDEQEQLNEEKPNGDLDGRTKPYKCPFCHRTFAREKALRNHIRIHNDNYDLTLECHKCHEAFDDIIYLQAHLLACINSESSDHQQQSQQEQQSNEEKCVPPSQEIMENDPDLDIYGARKVGENTTLGDYECNVCSKRFKTRQKVFRHMWVHRKKSHNCEVCGLSFPAVKFLDDHRLALHPSNTPFSCSHCGKSFMSKQGMVEHMRQHQGFNEQYYCAFCEKFFSSRQGFTIHGRIHTGERPYGCKYCHKAFRDGGTLKKHERIHTGERPHECPLCHKRYNQKVVLREHIRGVHVMKRNSDINDKCPICDMSDLDKEEMSEHIVKHSDQLMRQLKMDSLKKEKQFDKLGPPNVVGSYKKRLKNREDDEEPTRRKRNEDGEPSTKRRKISQKRNQFRRIRIPKKPTIKNESEQIDNVEKNADPICEPSLLTDNSGSESSYNGFENQENNCLNELNQDSKSGIVECEMCRLQFPTRSELITHVFVHI